MRTTRDESQQGPLLLSGTSLLAALGLAATACGTTASPATMPTQTTQGQTQPSTQTAAVRQVWVTTNANVAQGRPQGAPVVRVRPDGKVVFVAGGGPTVAYDATSGRQL